LVELLIHENRQVSAAAQGGDRASADRLLRDELAPATTPLAAAPAPNHPIDERVVGGAIDLGDVDAALPGRERRDLPIRQMAREQDHPPIAGDGPLDMFEAADLDASAIENADTAQMRV